MLREVEIWNIEFGFGHSQEMASKVCGGPKEVIIDLILVNPGKHGHHGTVIGEFDSVEQKIE